jgi:hypothetical protein
MLTIVRWQSPVLLNWSTDKEQGQFATDKAESDKDAKPIEIFSLCDAITATSSQTRLPKKTNDLDRASRRLT